MVLRPQVQPVRDQAQLFVAQHAAVIHRAVMLREGIEERIAGQGALIVHGREATLRVLLAGDFGPGTGLVVELDIALLIQGGDEIDAQFQSIR